MYRLHFDPANPRFPEGLDGTDPTQVLSFMLDDAGLIDLMRSIASQGFFPGEPLLVAPHPTEANDYVVIEGNRRLAATYLLTHPDEAPVRKAAVSAVAAEAAPPAAIPSLKFANRDEILKHVGYRHVTGIKEWEPLAKARFLKQRYELLDGPPEDRFKQLARTIGSRSDYVGRLLTAYATYRAIEQADFYAIPGLSQNTIDFSLVSSVLGYSNIVNYLGISSSQNAALIGLHASHLEFLARWVFEKQANGRTRLGESRHIRMLADVVANVRAVTALEMGHSLQAAAKLAGAGGEAFRSALAAALENLQLALNNIDDLQEPSGTDVQAANEIRAIALDIRKVIQGRLDADDDA